MDNDELLWAAGRDLALLRRCGNPEIGQTETFNNIALLRRLFVDDAIHTYWKALRSDERAKFRIEYSSIRTKCVETHASYFFVLTGDQWSDLLLAGTTDCWNAPEEAHCGMTLGPVKNHLKSSIVLAHNDFEFTPKEIIDYHAYTLGEVHLATKEKVRVDAYNEMLRSAKERYPVQFGNNGPASLALKGFVNRVTRSAAFRHMFSILKENGKIPSDVEFPAIQSDGLRRNIQKSGYDAEMMSLLWTERAREKGMHQTLGLPLLKN